MPMSQAKSIGYDILCTCCFSGSEMSSCMGMETKSVSFKDPMAKPQTLALYSIHPPHGFNQYDHGDLICFDRRFLSSTLDEMTFNTNKNTDTKRQFLGHPPVSQTTVLVSKLNGYWDSKSCI